MNTQLRIPYNDLGEPIKKWREAQALNEFVKQQKEIEHLKRVIAGFKGYRTKRKKKKND